MCRLRLWLILHLLIFKSWETEADVLGLPDDIVFDPAELFLLREREMLPRCTAAIALVQLIPDMIPGFIALCYFRLPGQLVHDGVHQCFERFLQIAILLFPGGGFQRLHQLAHLLLDDRVVAELMLHLLNQLPHGIRQRLIAEARDRMLRQFLLDAPEIFLRIGIVRPAAIGEGHSSYWFALCHLLLAQIVAVEIALIIPRRGGAAEAVAVMLGFHNIAEAPAILRDSTAVPIAVGSHRRQILERANCPEGIQDLLKLTFELIGVEPVAVMGPPGMVESFPGRTKVHSNMADRAQHRILGLVQLGIEKARLLTGSGPQRKGIFCFYWRLQLHAIHLHHFCKHNQYHNESGKSIRIFTWVLRSSAYRIAAPGTP